MFVIASQAVASAKCRPGHILFSVERENNQFNFSVRGEEQKRPNRRPKPKIARVGSSSGEPLVPEPSNLSGMNCSWFL